MVYQGDQYAQHKKYGDSLKCYDESIKLLKTSYGALKGKIKISLLMNLPTVEIDFVVDKFCELGPTNPTVPIDLIEIFLADCRDDYLIHTLKRKINDYHGDFEAQGNFHYSLGLLYQDLDDNDKSKFHFTNSRTCFKRSLPKDHYVFKNIKTMLKKL